MPIAKAQQYIDTSISGLVVVIEHNLDGLPFIQFTTYDNGSYTYVPLYDSRIAEVKTLDTNNIQVTFSSLFQGFLDMIVVEVDDPDDHTRLLSAEENIIRNYELIGNSVSSAQQNRMNTLTTAQVRTLETALATLQSQVNTLTTRVDSL